MTKPKLDLLPCPFCGEMPTQEYWITDRDVHTYTANSSIDCKNCEFDGKIFSTNYPLDKEDCRDKAIDWWNTRPQPSKFFIKNVSKCCYAKMQVDSADEGTSCCICKKCGKPCDWIQSQAVGENKSFESFLESEFLPNYHSNDKDKFQSAFDKWLGELEIDDWIKYGDKFRSLLENKLGVLDEKEIARTLGEHFGYFGCPTLNADGEQIAQFICSRFGTRKINVEEIEKILYKYCHWFKSEDTCKTVSHAIILYLKGEKG